MVEVVGDCCGVGDAEGCVGEFVCLFGQGVGVGVGAEGDDFVFGWVVALFVEGVEVLDCLEGLGADGAGGAEDSDPEDGWGGNGVVRVAWHG